MGKLKLSTKYWGDKTPYRVERILKSIRRIIALSMGASYISGNEALMFILLILGGIIEEGAGFIGEEIKGKEYKRVTIDTPMQNPEDQTIKEETINPKE